MGNTNLKKKIYRKHERNNAFENVFEICYAQFRDGDQRGLDMA